MRAAVLVLFIVTAGWCDDTAPTAVGVLENIYSSCLHEGSVSCVKPKFLSFLSSSLKKDKILITEDLAIVGNGRFMNDLNEVSEKLILSIEETIFCSSQ